MKPAGVTITTPALDRHCMRPGHGDRMAVKRIGGRWRCPVCVKTYLIGLARVAKTA